MTVKKQHYPTVAQSFGITGIVILGMLFLSPVMFLKSVIGQEATMLLYYLLSVGLPAWFVFTIRKQKENHPAIAWQIENKRIVPYLVVATAALLFGIVSPVGNLIPMPDSIKKAFLELGSMTSVWAFLMMVVAAPLLEEFIFRGIVLDGLLKNYPPVKAVFISSLLFGLVHLNPWQFVTGFFIGLFMGWVYYYTRSLLATIIIHATANLSGFVLRFWIDPEKMMDETIVEAYGGVGGLILSIVICVIAASVCIYFLKKEFMKAPAINWKPRLVDLSEDATLPEETN